VLKRACAIVASVSGLAMGQQGLVECGTVTDGEAYDAYAARVLAGVHELPVQLGRSEWVVPVVFHVVRRSDGTGGISEARLEQGMIDLAIGFAGTPFTFCRPIETRFIDDDALYQRFDNDDIDVMLAQAAAHAINVVCAPNATVGGTPVCGAATLPGGGISYVLMRNSCLGTASNPSTLTHEIGHYFDLVHTHDGHQCADGRDCDITGDLICDTPPDPGLNSGNVDRDCVYTGTGHGPCDGDSLWNPDTRNHMSYSRPLCRVRFSQGQVDRMVGALLNLRPDLAFSECPELRADPGMELASRRPDGGYPDSHSLNARVLGHGRFLVFDSYASDVVDGDTNGLPDVFLLDRATGQTTIVSVGPDSSSGDGWALGAHGSADGILIAFVSNAGGYGVPDENGKEDIYLKNMIDGSIRRITLAYDGGETDGDSFVMGMTPGGQLLLLASEATNLVPGDTNGVQDIFLYELATGAIERVSLTHDGGQALGGASGSGSMSDDGRFIAFTSAATNLVPGDTNGVQDVFLLDRAVGKVRRLSVGAAGEEADGRSYGTVLSGDGSLVSFVSDATNLVHDDDNGHRDAFVHEIASGRTSLVTVGHDGAAADGDTTRAAISGDGRYVVLHSAASNLVEFRSPPVHAQVYVKDLKDGGMELASRGVAGWFADGQVSVPSISRGGRLVAFSTAAKNMLEVPSPGAFHVYTLDRLASCPADFDDNGALDTLDVLAFLVAWSSRDGAADFNLDGAVDTQDVLAFLNAWAAGC
jgi:Tol biopolymer transport system component